MAARRFRPVRWQVLNLGALGSGAVNDNSVLAFKLATASVYSQPIGGSGSLVLSAGSLTLPNANTYSGGTTLSGGLLNYGNVGAMGSGTVTLGNATLQAGLSGPLSNNMVLSKGNTGTIDTQAYTVTSGGVISGSGALTKVGLGTLVLGGIETYSGPTKVSAGTLDLTGAMGSSYVTVAGGAAFLASPSSGTPPTTAVKGLTLNAGGSLYISGSNDKLDVNTTSVITNAALTFGIGVGGAYDQMAVTNAITVQGHDTINIVPVASGGSLQLGTYPLITASTGLQTGLGVNCMAFGFTSGTVAVENEVLTYNGTRYLLNLSYTPKVEKLTIGMAPPSYIPWAEAAQQSFVPLQAAVGLEPTTGGTAGALANFGQQHTFALGTGDSFSIVPFPQTTINIPEGQAYAQDNTTTNLGNSGGGQNNYPSGPDRNKPGGDISPFAPSTGPATAPGINPGTTMNVTGVYPIVASSVTSNSGSTPYSDPPGRSGVPLSLTNSNDPAFAPGANAAIIAGTFAPSSSASTGITMSWRTRSPTEQDKYTVGAIPGLLPSKAAYLASDVLSLQGQAAGTDYVLQMDFSNEVETPGDQMNDITAGKDLFLGELVNAGSANANWVNAVSRNTSVGAYAWQPSDLTETLASTYTSPAHPSTQPYIGSFQSFLNSTYIQGGVVHYFYEHSLDQLRGTWGIDTSSDTAWAVLDVGSGIFAVVPEPATIRLVAGGMLSLAMGFWWRRCGRIQAVKTAKPAKRKS